MIEGMDFIFTGLQGWDMAIGSNARDMALEISKHNRVLYVNTPLDIVKRKMKAIPEDLRRRMNVLSGQAQPLRQINANLWVLDCPFTILPVNTLPDGCLFDLVNRCNNYKTFRFIKQYVQKLGFKEYIHINDNSIHNGFYAKEYLPAVLSVYYRRDNLLAVPYWRRHCCRLEPLLIKKSDLVACNSQHLAEVARPYNSATFDIGQGVDLTSYNCEGLTTPCDVARLPHPVVGYVGMVTGVRLDVELLYRLADQNPNISLVLVGGVDEIFGSHSINELTNVHFLGMKPLHQVPAYINSFDICINPQIVNDVTIGNYPRKVDEYLAMGKPVISTVTSTMEHRFKDYVHLCSTDLDYQRAIETILGGDDQQQKQRRIEFAHTHSWQASVGALYDAIDQKLR